MDFVDSAGIRYQLTETVETPAHAQKPVVWPWVVGGLAVAGGLAWMASHTSRKANPVTPEIEALIEEARNPETEPRRLVELVNHSEVEVRRALLDNPNVCPTNAEGELDVSLLENLAQPFPEEVANHPLFVLHALIEPINEFKRVVRAVVQRTKDVGLVERIWSTWGPSSEYVRQGVALNPSTPIDVLRTLGNETTESHAKVRQAVASNPSTPEDLLRSLGIEATESEGYVRKAVAQNPNTPVDVLRTLGNQQNEAWGVRKSVASNPSTPGDVLRILGNRRTEPDGDVRQAVARNPNTPVEVLRILGNEQTESLRLVRQVVAENPNSPVDVLRLLGNEQTESNRWVREAAKSALALRGLT